jgi:hypothetical protein
MMVFRSWRIKFHSPEEATSLKVGDEALPEVRHGISLA